MNEEELPPELESVFELSNNLLKLYQGHSVHDIELASSLSLLNVFWSAFDDKEAEEKAHMFIAQFLFLAAKHAEEIKNENHTLQ